MAHSPISQAEIEQLRTAPLLDVLASFGFRPARKQGREFVFKSPLREGDSDPSFFVDPERNIWNDFGLMDPATGRIAGGNVVDFTRRYLPSWSFPDVAAMLRPFVVGGVATAAAVEAPRKARRAPVERPRKPARELLELKLEPLSDPGLLAWLRDVRKLNVPAILNGNPALRQLLLQARYRSPENPTARYVNLAFLNHLGAPNMELKGPGKQGATFTSVHGHKAYTLIPGSKARRSRLHIFEGVMDYLALLMLQQEQYFYDDCLILNSITQSEAATLLAREYEQLWLWLDNDPEGHKCATYWLAAHPNVEDKADEYAEYEDVNDWLRGIRMADKPPKPPRGALVKMVGQPKPAPADNAERSKVARWWLAVRWQTPQVDRNGKTHEWMPFYSRTDTPDSLAELRTLRTELVQQQKLKCALLCERQPGLNVHGFSNFKVLKYTAYDK